MSDDLQKLYEKLSETKLFENMAECDDCEFKCKGTLRERFLLKDEVRRLKRHFPNIVEVEGAFFFKEEECPNLKDGKCSIYDMRPLECRITPLKFLGRDGRLYWILTKPCKLVETTDPDKLAEVIEMANRYVDKIEPSIPAALWEELVASAKAINTFNPYREGKDCIILREAALR